MRSAIEDAADRGVIIVNIDNGYFIPTEEDTERVRAYFHRELKRALSMLHHARKVGHYLDVDKNQMKVEDL